MFSHPVSPAKVHELQLDWYIKKINDGYFTSHCKLFSLYFPHLGSLRECTWFNLTPQLLNEAKLTMLMLYISIVISTQALQAIWEKSWINFLIRSVSFSSGEKDSEWKWLPDALEHVFLVHRRMAQVLHTSSWQSFQDQTQWLIQHTEKDGLDHAIIQISFYLWSMDPITH